MNTDGYKLLFSREDIGREVRRIASEIAQRQKGEDIVLIGVLKGSFMFLADLVRAIEDLELVRSVTVTFLGADSYGDEQKSSGVVEIGYDVQGRFVLNQRAIIVEDVVDTELTLKSLIRHLKAKQPYSIEICALVRKELHGTRLIRLDYLGFDEVSGWIKGYGMDEKQKDRGLPDIWVKVG